MKKFGKKYKEKLSLIDKSKKYSTKEGIELLKKLSFTKFNGTVELHLKTFADPKYNDQMIRGTIVLPNGIGKSKKIGAFLSDDKIELAKSLGADVVGNTDLLKNIEEGKINFDVLITTPDMVRDLAKVAKVLGPKGLMPNAKVGTITQNLKETIDEIKKGRVEYKIDKGSNLHFVFGKISFDENKLVENLDAILKNIQENKPSGVKGKLIKKACINICMGPSIILDI